MGSYVIRRPTDSYVIKRNRDMFDVVHLGPTVVAAELKWIEAEALAKALNEEKRKRDDQN